MTWLLSFLLVMFRPAVLIGSSRPAATSGSEPAMCVCGCPQTDHGHQGTSWCYCGCCSYFQLFNPEKWWTGP